ncbi:hypothetical protein Tco_1549576 [Tanacetum coccineum]
MLRRVETLNDDGCGFCGCGSSAEGFVSVYALVRSQINIVLKDYKDNFFGAGAGSVEGQVIEMRFTTTSLLSVENFPIVVPNSLFSSQVGINSFNTITLLNTITLYCIFANYTALNSDSGLLVYKEPLSSLRKKYRLSLKNDMPPRDNDNVGVEQLGVLYGDVNWKMFEVSMLKPSLMSGLRGSLFFDGEQRVGQSRSEENEESKKGVVLVSQVQAVIVVYRERAPLEDTRRNFANQSWRKPSTILEVNWLEKQWSIIDKLVSSVVERFVETGLRCIKLVLGGEVCLWGETIDGSDIDHTIWSHVAAAADT